MSTEHRVQVLPASFAQQRLWLLHQLVPDSPAHQHSVALRLTGAVDASALNRALREVQRRHASLRTTFREEAGSPVQVVHPELPLVVDIEELRAEVPAAREDAWRQRALDEARRPFDPSRGPLVRVSLLRLAEHEHVLLLTLHALIADERSVGLLLEELGVIHDALRQDQPSPLALLTAQPADFAQWQREALAQGALEEQLAWWKQHLVGAPATLELLTDRPRPPISTFRGARLRHELPRELSEAVRRLGASEGLSPSHTVLGIFVGLLSRTTGQQDVVVGIPLSQRTRPEMEGLIGALTHPGVLRTELSGDPSVRELLRRVREVTRGAQAHADVPFERVVEALRPRMDPSRAPLFQVRVVPREDEPGHLAPPGWSARPLEVERGTSPYDLTLFIHPGPEGALVTAWEYSTDLFDFGTVARLARHLEVLLSGASESPERPLSQQPLLSAAERHQVLGLSRGAPPGPREELFMHRLVRGWAEREPAEVAVLQGSRQLTYGELWRRATQLAHLLRARGVGPDVRVGLLLGRSPEMVVGLLAVLEAGGAYVPLDPDYPHERLDFMRENSGVSLLVTESRLLGRLTRPPARVICLDTDAALLEATPARPLEDLVSPDNLACLLYTSGSAGRPKGVMMSHRNLAHATLARLELYSQPVERFLLLSSFSFDSALAGLFWTLMRGGALVLPEPTATGAIDFTLQFHLPTHLLCVPSTYAVLLERSRAHLTSLRTVIVGGEVCPPELVTRHAEALPTVELYNEYGPTEASVWSTVQRCAPGAAPVSQRVPIGRPIPGVHVYVLDARGEPQPVGVPGVLYLGGTGVARGYLGRPERTAERFVPDALGGEAGDRLYRTGDLARWLPQGVLEFLGRVDAQVKVRGYRIEPGEVESALRQHPRVREAAVAVRGSGGEARLMAWVVSQSLPPPDAPTLREHLRALLPEYLVPSHFLTLERLPRTPNGKVNRTALPTPEAQRWLDAAPVVPRPGLESQLAALWGELLGVTGVGAQDNFFELGGRSRLLLVLRARLTREFGFELPLVEFFRFPTVRSLAERLRRPGALPPAE